MFNSTEVLLARFTAWVSGSRFEQRKEKGSVVELIGKPGGPIPWPFNSKDISEAQARLRENPSFWDPANTEEKTWIEVRPDGRVAITTFKGVVPTDILRKETFRV